MQKRNETHIPVLKDEVLAYLIQNPQGLYVDGTVGLGGHAEGLLENLSKEGHLLAIDRDKDALELAQEKLKPYREQVTFVQDDFRHLKEIIEKYSFPSPVGILLDLGISSLQVDDPERGFSYFKDGPLDMRMDQEKGLCASQIINTYSQGELAYIFKEYGEERWANRIGSFIIKKRREGPIKRTKELVEIIKGAIPARYRRTGPHPARRTFMALRIAVNDELKALEEALKDALPLLEVGGRMAIITFHSLEDRVVKKTFKELAKDCICPKDFPICTCHQKQLVKILTKKPILPKGEELQENPRSRSGKLRVIEKV